MFMVYTAKEHDLSQYNVVTEDGTTGWIFDNYVEEIDIESGELHDEYLGSRSHWLTDQARRSFHGVHWTTLIQLKVTLNQEIQVSVKSQPGIFLYVLLE
jgi:hypothetical protein